MSSSTPDTALTQKPSHIALKNGSIACSGRPRAKPSIRTSSATLAPTRNASPTVCRIRMIGKAPRPLANPDAEPGPLDPVGILNISVAGTEGNPSMLIAGSTAIPEELMHTAKLRAALVLASSLLAVSSGVIAQTHG